MPKAFDFSSPPFDRLRPMEVERVSHVVDVVFFRTGQTVLAAGTLPDQFYVVIKGLVEERAGDGDRGRPRERRRVRQRDPGAPDHAGTTSSCARRRSATRCRSRTSSSSPPTTPAFAAFFFKDISHKLEALGQRQASPQALGAHDHPGATRRRSTRRCSSPPETTLHEAAVHMDRAGQRALLVRDGDAHRHLHRRRPHPHRRGASASRWRRRCATSSTTAWSGSTRTASCSRRPC